MWSVKTILILMKHTFQPGNTYSVGKGRPRLPEDLKHIKKLTKSEIDLRLNKLLAMKKADLEKLVNDKHEVNNLDMLDYFIACVIVNGCKHGDHKRLDFIFDRLIGKVHDKVEVSTPRPTVIKLLDGEGEIHLTSEQPVEDIEIEGKEVT